MAKSKKPLAEQYKSVSGSFRKKISEARKQGYDINYKINKPEQLTQEFIDTLRSIKIADIKQGVDIDGISVESYYTGEMDLRPTKRTYIEDYEDIPEYQSSIDTDLDNTVPSVKFKVPELKNKTVGGITGEELFELEENIDVSDTDIGSRFIHKDVKEFEVLEDNRTVKTYQENVEAYYDTETNEVVSKFSPDLFERDKMGRKIYDNRQAVIKDKFVPIMISTMDKESYESLVWDNIVARYGGFFNNERAEVFRNYLSDLRSKYGSFALRDALIKAEDNGYKFDYEAFYKASDEDFAGSMNALSTILATEGEYNQSDFMDMNDYIEGIESGFDIDYKNG